MDHQGLLIAHPNDKLCMQLNLLHSGAQGYQGLEEIAHTLARGAGDVLFLYTDGLTEAQDAQGAFFTGPRMVATINALQDRRVRELIGVCARRSPSSSRRPRRRMT